MIHPKNEALPVPLTQSDTSSTHLTLSPNSNSSSPLSLLNQPSHIQSQPYISTGSGTSCRVLSIDINLALTCEIVPSINAPHTATCIVTQHDEDVLYISIPNLTLS